MKKLLLSFTCMILSAITVISQNNSLIVYSQDGYAFTIILNGVKQNTKPETNVKVTGLNATNYQVKLIFANKKPDLDKTVYLMDGGVATQNTEYSYAVVNSKGILKLRYKSAAPIPGVAAAPTPQQTIIVYKPVAVTTTTTTSTTSTTSSHGNGNGAGTGANINVNANGVNVNINANDGTSSSNNSTSTTTYSTTTTTTTSGGGNHHNGNGHNDNDDHPHDGYMLEGYNGIYGCPHPMKPADFDAAKASIKAKSFDDSKILIAKQVIGSNCLLCSQIKELMELFSFEDSKLDIAKFSWHHVLDKGNYFKLNDAFTFDASVEELNKYTQSH